MSHLPIWYIGTVPKEECNKAFSELIKIFPKNATMGIEGNKQDKNTRDTTVRFAEKNYWFSEVMQKYAILANTECKWDFDLQDYEAIQFAEYKLGQKYNWHQDTFFLSGATNDRKITVVCLLNDSTEFEGGLLQIRFNQEYTPELKNTLPKQTN